MSNWRSLLFYSLESSSRIYNYPLSLSLSPISITSTVSAGKAETSKVMDGFCYDHSSTCSYSTSPIKQLHSHRSILFAIEITRIDSRPENSFFDIYFIRIFITVFSPYLTFSIALTILLFFWTFYILFYSLCYQMNKGFFFSPI